MKKLTTILLTFVLLLESVPTVWAKPKGDWGAVKALVNHSIAIRTRSGETKYGLMQSADDVSIRIQLAGEEDFTSQEITVRRDEVEKVWRARLRFGEKNIAKGAWIGAGAGLGGAWITAAVYAKGSDGDSAPGVVLFPLYGAAIGAFAGKFWKKRHKKQHLVYSI